MATYYCGCAGGLEGEDTDFSRLLGTQASDLDKVFVRTITVRHGMFVDKIGFVWEMPSTGDIFQAEIGGSGGAHTSYSI